MSDADLDNLLAEALHQAKLRRPQHRERKETHLDYARRLAEKGLFRRLAREAHSAMDALRFEWWFSRQSDLTLDQWRVYIDTQIEREKRRSEIESLARAKATGEVEEVAPINGSTNSSS